MTISSVPSATSAAAMSEDIDAAHSGSFPVMRDYVATSIADTTLLASVRDILSTAGLIDGGHGAVESAWTVIVEGGCDAIDALAAVRARIRSDAAVIMIVRTRENVAAALGGGAFGCVQQPLVAAELLAVVGAAAAARTAKLEAADLTRKLDLQSHLASIGRVSAGLTHELGSPLAVARLSVDSLEEDLTAYREMASAFRYVLDAANDGELATRARSVGAAALRATPMTDAAVLAELRESHQRVADILAVMRELIGKRPTTREPLSLRDVSKRVAQWARSTMDADVSVELVHEDEDIAAIGQVRLVEQILVNLVENALHAVKGLSSPRIRIHTYARGNEAIVSVRDNGRGIPQSIQDHLFEPFVTTRRGEGGTGLGLSLCREYARQMGADLSLATARGRGSCFRLRLRRAT